MLSTLNELGYNVEWRVINAADYGNAQRRRRVFIFGYKQDLDYANLIDKHSLEEMIYKYGMFAEAFPIQSEPNKNRINSIAISKDIVEISDEFSFQFYNSGIMKNGNILTIDTIPKYEKSITLGEIVLNEVDDNYTLSEEHDGHEYYFSEGGMSEFDALDLPARTMLTSEASVNRSSHF